MLRKIDLSPIIIKNAIANSMEEIPMPIYDDPITIYGKIIDKGGIIVEEPTGINFEYDRAIIFNVNEKTKYINAQTAIYVDEIPTIVYPNGDYSIERITPIALNTFTVYLNKRNGITIPKLYFENDNKIVEMQLNYDKDKNIAYISKNKKIPFNSETNIWNRKVNDISSNVGKIRLVKTEPVLKSKHIKLIFEEVND